MNKNSLGKIGSSLFFLGWVLVIAYASSPLWQGRQLLKSSDHTKSGILITDLPGGAEFAASQSSKPGAGSTPRLIPIEATTDKPYFVLLTWGYSNFEVDMRWSPALLQHDGKRFIYAQGEQTPSRSGKASGKRVPSTHVMKLPWKGDLDERVYAITPGAKYFVFLPQAGSKSIQPYSIELRHRKTGAEQPTHLLLIGLAALFGGVLLLIKYSRKTQNHSDPAEAARTYARWRRFAQARQILHEGLRKQPSRKVEFQQLLQEIALMENSSEPGRVSAPGFQSLKYRTVAIVLGSAFIAYSVWSSFQFDSAQLPKFNQQAQKMGSEQVTAQALAKLPKEAASFDLQDSQWAFAALGRGTLAAGTNSLTIQHDTLRVMQLADCPSDACRPIRSMQWLLVTPQSAAEPSGAWTAVAKSDVKTIEFSPTQRNDQHLINAGQASLKIEHKFDPAQTSVILQLTAEGGLTTYSRSSMLWTNAKVPAGVQQSAAPSSKGKQSLYASLFYADAAATREHIKAGASVRERYENDASAAHIAAFSGCAECLDALKAAGADLNDKVSTFRQETPLMMAIRNRQVAAARRLIELGANPCISDREGYDAMGWVKFYKLESAFPFISTCEK
jgi:Ankyrin repeats (3 copies)